MTYVAYCKALIDLLSIKSSEVQSLVDAAERVRHYAILYPGFFPHNTPDLGYVLVLLRSGDGALPRLRLAVSVQPGLPCARVTLEDNTVVPVNDLLDLRITEMPEAEQQAMQDHFCWHILRNKTNALLSAQQVVTTFKALMFLNNATTLLPSHLQPTPDQLAEIRQRLGAEMLPIPGMDAKVLASLQPFSQEEVLKAATAHEVRLWLEQEAAVAAGMAPGTLQGAAGQPGASAAAATSSAPAAQQPEPLAALDLPPHLMRAQAVAAAGSAAPATAPLPVPMQPSPHTQQPQAAAWAYSAAPGQQAAGQHMQPGMYAPPAGQLLQVLAAPAVPGAQAATAAAAAPVQQQVFIPIEFMSQLVQQPAAAQAVAVSAGMVPPAAQSQPQAAPAMQQGQQKQQQPAGQQQQQQQDQPTDEDAERLALLLAESFAKGGEQAEEATRLLLSLVAPGQISPLVSKSAAGQAGQLPEAAASGATGSHATQHMPAAGPGAPADASGSHATQQGLEAPAGSSKGRGRATSPRKRSRSRSRSHSRSRSERHRRDESDRGPSSRSKPGEQQQQQQAPSSRSRDVGGSDKPAAKRRHRSRSRSPRDDRSGQRSSRPEHRDGSGSKRNTGSSHRHGGSGASHGSSGQHRQRDDEPRNGHTSEQQRAGDRQRTDSSKPQQQQQQQHPAGQKGYTPECVQRWAVQPHVVAALRAVCELRRTVADSIAPPVLRDLEAAVQKGRLDAALLAVHDLEVLPLQGLLGDAPDSKVSPEDVEGIVSITCRELVLDKKGGQVVYGALRGNSAACAAAPKLLDHWGGQARHVKDRLSELFSDGVLKRGELGALHLCELQPLPVAQACQALQQVRREVPQVRVRGGHVSRAVLQIIRRGAAER